MKIRAFFIGLAIAVVLIPFTGLIRPTVSHAAPAAATQPNVVFILTDDQGYGDLAAHGHPALKTPHLDALAAQSVRFTDFQVAATCSPSRAEILTGLHHFRTGVTHTISPRDRIDAGATILPQILKNAGYVTAMIGKWHNGGGKGYQPTDRGFDFDITTMDPLRKPFGADVSVNGRAEKRTGFREDVFFDEAIRFIEKNQTRPFFCYLATYSPHEPLVAPEEDIRPYRGLPGMSEKTATYLGMVANIDKNVGRLLDRIRELGLDERTIIVFMNDNGATYGLDLYNAGMRGGKTTPWLGGTRAMSFWRWSGHWKPRDVETLTSAMDVLPTLAQVASAPSPVTLQSRLDGYSLVPLLEGGQAVWADERMVFQHVARWPDGTAAAHKYAGGCGVRWKEYLLLRNRPCADLDGKCSSDNHAPCNVLRGVEKGGNVPSYPYSANPQLHAGVTTGEGWALYDVRRDPACENNLAAARTGVGEKLRAAYDAWWDGTFAEMIAAGGDECPEGQK